MEYLSTLPNLNAAQLLATLAKGANIRIEMYDYFSLNIHVGDMGHNLLLYRDYK